MNKTIFDTPIITPLLRVTFGLLQSLAGWKVVAPEPLPSPPCIIIAAPHTSNWDFGVMIFSAFKLNLKIHWMGKHTIFKPPFSGIMKWMGGIPINRNAAGNVVSQMVQKFNETSQLIILIPPEGTRKKVPQWKSGFYHIAYGAGVPIVMVGIDGKNKELRLLGSFTPTGDFDSDLPKIKKYYESVIGIIPENT